MTLRAVLLAALLAPAAHAEPRLAGAGTAVARNVTASGGARASGGGYTLDSVVGEGGIAAAAGAGFKTSAGLAPLLAQPGTVAAITAVSKSTGTLTLAWTSPGQDGLVGDVVSGWYRIDWSSDALHVFDPSKFSVELPTTTSPGAAQSYALTGLLPNTTYYSRIYLADARKFVAETSYPSAESSLARLPDAPVFTGVWATSVTISWALPVGGAAGFRLDASSAGFAAGSVVSSASFVATDVTLTVEGLDPDTDYFFNLGSLNWQSDVDFASVMSTHTLTIGGVYGIAALHVAGDARARRVTLTWTNRNYPNMGGVTVLVSSSPISSALANGTDYPVGTRLPDGSQVAASALATSYVEQPLELDVTGYFRLFSRSQSNVYSVGVSTSLVLDLPPMAPAGLAGTLSSGATSFLLSWAPVSSSLDGAAFASTAAPTAWELHRYDVYRSTGIVRANWVWVGSAPANVSSFAADVPPAAVSYYRVVSRDAFDGGLNDNAMAIDTLGNLWAVHPDLVSRLQIPAANAAMVRATGNPLGRPLLIRAEDRPTDIEGRTVVSASFDPVLSPSNLPAKLAPADVPFDVALHYATSGGMVVPLGAGSPTANAPENLSAYFVDSGKGAQVFGRVDTSAQEVALRSTLLGTYQVRTVMRNAGFSFDLAGVSNRALTPNGDGLNDTVVFTFDNPHDAAVRGTIFDVRGRRVADMGPGPIAGSSLMWDAKAGGQVVPRGVYLYQIEAEKKTFTGTVVVIR